MKAQRALLWILVPAAVAAAVHVLPGRPAAAAVPKAVPVKTAPATAPALKLANVTVSAALKAALSGKRIFNPSLLESRLSYTASRTPLLKLASGNVVALQKVEVEPMPPAAVTPAIVAAKLRRFQAYLSKPAIGRAKVGAAPEAITAVDHTDQQTPIRNQAGRGTCVAHAAVAALEALYNRAGVSRDISENHAYNVFMAKQGSTCMADPGLPTWKAAQYLTSDRVCLESESAYVNSRSSECSVVPEACSSHKRYGHFETATYFSPEFGGTGYMVVTNTSFLESLLAAGYDVVLGVHVAGNDWEDGTAETGLVDVQITPGGSPAPAYGGHAMLLVGYDQAGNTFKFKNSWGSATGHAGYFHLTYEYLQTYAKYGYVIERAS